MRKSVHDVCAKWMRKCRREIKKEVEDCAQKIGDLKSENNLKIIKEK